MNQEMTGVTLAPARHLPSPLIAARAAAMHRLNCLDLTLTARRTLYGILTFVSINNLSREIFPRRETLRQEAMLGSDGTLYRGLAMLEAKGYITRNQRRLAHSGKFHLSPILLTDKAIQLLGLRELIHQHRSCKMEDGQYKERTKDQQSYQKTSANADSAVVIDPETRLPNDLVPLLSLDVRKSAICMLMKESREYGKRLSDVVKSVWHNIYRLRGREVVAYLSYLIKQDRDFASKAEAMDEKVASDQRTSRYQNTLESLDERYDGGLVVDSSGRDFGIFRFSASGLSHVSSWANGRPATMPVNLKFAERFAEGELRIRF